MHLHVIARWAVAASLKLISHKLCPYVQRAVIALTEKGVGFERVDIDLANKPDWFLAISPLGKTPVLVVGGQAEACALAKVSRRAAIGEIGRERQLSGAAARLHRPPPVVAIALAGACGRVI